MNFREAIRGKKAALIDMDGVLYDSMPKHCRAWRSSMAKYGLDIPYEEFFLYEGMTGEATINLLMQREKGVTLTREKCDEIYKAKADEFAGMGNVNMMDGADEMIRILREEGLTTVLVTGSAQGSLLDRLENDYPGAFPKERRVTALDVTRGKPDPEPYLRGLEKARVKAEEAVVIENAPLGVRAGKAAGVFTIAVMTGPIPREAFEKEGADLILSRGGFGEEPVD